MDRYFFEKTGSVIIVVSNLSVSLIYKHYNHYFDSYWRSSKTFNLGTTWSLGISIFIFRSSLNILYDHFTFGSLSGDPSGFKSSIWQMMIGAFFHCILAKLYVRAISKNKKILFKLLFKQNKKKGQINLALLTDTYCPINYSFCSFLYLFFYQTF